MVTATKQEHSVNGTWTTERKQTRKAPGLPSTSKKKVRAQAASSASAVPRTSPSSTFYFASSSISIHYLRTVRTAPV